MVAGDGHDFRDNHLVLDYEGIEVAMATDRLLTCEPFDSTSLGKKTYYHRHILCALTRIFLYICKHCINTAAVVLSSSAKLLRVRVPEQCDTSFRGTWVVLAAKQANLKWNKLQIFDTKSSRLCGAEWSM